MRFRVSAKQHRNRDRDYASYRDTQNPLKEEHLLPSPGFSVVNSFGFKNE